MKKTWITTLYILILFTACKSGKNTDVVSQERPVSLTEVYNWVNNKEFAFRADWATPLRSERIMVSDIANGIIVRNDSIVGQLPFYGVRQVGYNFTESGIKLSGQLKNPKVDVNESRNAILFKFDVAEKGEVFEFQITVFGNKTAYVDVNSNERDSMRYQGELKKITNQKN
tara:strand:+ start:77 stop:589 length:513 start_codon:yes stop_codon:yes gene_type:complete